MRAVSAKLSECAELKQDFTDYCKLLRIKANYCDLFNKTFACAPRNVILTMTYVYLFFAILVHMSKSRFGIFRCTRIVLPIQGKKSEGKRRRQRAKEAEEARERAKLAARENRRALSSPIFQTRCCELWETQRV